MAADYIPGISESRRNLSAVLLRDALESDRIGATDFRDAYLQALGHGFTDSHDVRVFVLARCGLSGDYESAAKVLDNAHRSGTYGS